MNLVVSRVPQLIYNKHNRLITQQDVDLVEFCMLHPLLFIAGDIQKSPQLQEKLVSKNYYVHNSTRYNVGVQDTTAYYPARMRKG